MRNLFLEVEKSSEQSMENFGSKQLADIPGENLFATVVVQLYACIITSPPDKIPNRPPGSTPTPSCQGTVPTCTSHAVAKALVELLHHKYFDCLQGEVIASLINLKQTNFARQWPHVFNGVTLALQVWDRGDEENKDWTYLDIGVVLQSEKKEPSLKMGVSIHLKLQKN